MQKSFDGYRSKNIAESVYYESIALCYTFYRQQLHTNTKPTVIEAKEVNVASSSNVLLDYIREKLAEQENNDIDKHVKKLDLNEVKTDCTVIKPEIKNATDGYSDLIKQCAALPKEWTVLQICKINNEYLGYTNFKRYFTHNRPIKFTSFCYSRSDILDDAPLQFHLTFPDGVNILETVHKIFFEMYKTNADDFSNAMQGINTECAKLIELMKQWIGPFIVFFSGKVQGAHGKQLEDEIYAKVDEFSMEHDFSSEQRGYLSQFARRIDLVNADGIETIAQEIGDSRPVQEAIKKFLSSLKLKTNMKGLQYYPCILVLDELLDTIPWEMLIRKQELTRFSSIYMLFDLFEEYKSDIVDGYLRITVQNGNALINPSADAKLDHMVKRMSNFYSYWLPHWSRIEQSVPKDGLVPLLSTADVYVYSGHGSSFQYLSQKDYATLKTKSVLLLFGCESANMSFHGRISEATTIYMHIHACKCPTVVGTLSVVTDLWTDITSIVLLSRWIPSEKKVFWKPIHVGTSTEAKNRILQLAKTVCGTFEPSLLAILAYIRSEKQFSIRMRATMVCRGLPVYNTLAESRSII